MYVKRAGALMASTVALALGLTGSAAAGTPGTILHGTTAEDVKVKLVVGEFGNATAFRIGRTEVECMQGGTLTNKAGTYRNLDTSDPGEFSDRRRASSESGRYRFKTKSTVRGEVGDDDQTWSGVFKLVTKVFEHGGWVDTCKLKTRWSAD
jgi:hypothetical protein